MLLPSLGSSFRACKDGADFDLVFGKRVTVLKQGDCNCSSSDKSALGKGPSLGAGSLQGGLSFLPSLSSPCSCIPVCSRKGLVLLGDRWKAGTYYGESHVGLRYS